MISLGITHKVTGNIPNINRNISEIRRVTQQFASNFLAGRQSFNVTPIRVASLQSNNRIINARNHLMSSSSYYSAVSGIILKDF